MVQVRKLALAVFAASTLASGAAHALGMGEIRVESALYEPLRAEIQLRDLKGVSEQQISVALAPDSAFEKAGIERSDLVSSLRFKPVFNGNSGYILVTSTRSMREPYLDFLINVKWPSGRVTKSFTVLLDPPNYTPATAYTAPREPEVSSAPAPQPAYQRYQQPQHPVYQPHYPPRTEVPPSSSYGYHASGADLQPGGTYRTHSTDTLWKIASAVAGRKSVYQTMLAIQDLNPDAFIGGNINRLKAGQVLHLPTHQQIASRSAQESMAEVREQAQSWKNPELGGFSSDQQLDARRHDKAASAAGGDASTDRLKVASGERGGSAGTQEGSSKGAGSGNDQALADRLAAAQEELDVSRRQNEELSSRVDSLQDQIEKLTKVVQLRDERLAALQQGQGGESALAAEPAKEQSAANQQPAAGSQAAAAGQANSAQPASQPATTTTATTAVKPKSQPVHPASQQPHKATPKPVSQNNGSQSQSGISWLLWLVLALVVLAVFGLMMVMGRSTKRRSQSAAATQRPQASLTKAGGSSEPAMSSQPAVPATPAAKAAPAAAAATASATPKPLVDPLKRADNLIRNKSFDQAVEVLQKAIKQDPQNDQLALKLLEAYAEKGDKDSFESYAKRFVNDGGDETQVEQLRVYYPGLFVQSEPEPMPAAKDDDFGQQHSPDEGDDVLLKAEESASAEPLEWNIDQPKEAEADKASQDAYEISLDENDMAGQSLEDLEKELADYPSIKDEPSATADNVIDLSEPEEAPVSDRQSDAATGADTGLESAGEGVGEFDFMAGTDEVGTKLELSKAYIELGDADGAKDMLNEVLAEGNDAQQQEARELLSKLD